MSYSSSSVATSPRGVLSWLLGSALMFGLLTCGDRSVFSAGAGNSGIDPLEILNLAVRPNAIFVLDSSGSMGETTAGTGGLSDDDPDTKIAIAKNVIRNVVSANQSRVSFQFGIYDQAPTTISVTSQTTQNSGNTRFQYTAKNPTPLATEPQVQLRLFEVPVGSNWTVSFANGNTSYVTLPLPARVYTGTELAQQIATLMEAQDGSGYAGSFSDPANAASPTFTFTRSSGSLPFRMNFSVMNATLRGFLRAAGASGSFTGDTNDVTSPYSITPNVGTFTSFTVAPPNSFVVSGAPNIRFGRGGTTFNTPLTNGTYTGANLANHIATRMAAADTGATSTGPPNSFVITGGPQIRIGRGATNFTGNLANATYTGAQLATHISDVMDTIDTGSNTVADYSGSYNTSTGVFTFTRAGTDTTNSFIIRWSNWSASLRGTVAASGGMGAPAADATDATSAPYSLASAGGLTAVTTTLDTYSGAYNTTTGVFTFTRAGSTGASFDIGWTGWTSSLATMIGAPGTNASDTAAPFSLDTAGLAGVATPSGSAVTNSGPGNSTAPLTLYSRSDQNAYDLTDGGNRYLSVMANKLFNGQTVTVLANGTPCSMTTTGAVVSPAVPPLTIQVVPVCGGAASTSVTYLMRGPTSINGAGASCGGFRTLVGLQECTNNNQLGSIDNPYLQNDLNFSGSSIAGYTETDGVGSSTTQPTQWGIRAAGSTPIAESLIDVRDIFINGVGTQVPPNTAPFVLPLPRVRAIWPVIATQTKKQRTFVIFVTDGDDTCDDTAGSDLGYSADDNALRAAHKAQQLYTRYVAAEPESSVTTYLVAFGSGASLTRANWIAWGGSGMKFGTGATGGPFVAATTGSGAAERWSRVPTVAEKNTLCPTCKDAIPATDAQALTTALQSVIDQGQTSGEFSDQQSITETVFEFTDLAPAATPNPTVLPLVTPSPYTPLSPETRFGTSIPVLLQSTFKLPDFDGHLKAFVRGDNGTPGNPNDDVSVEKWDAGAKLIQRVVTDSGAMGVVPTYTFAQLYGNATPTTVKTSSARIKRRIFTSSGQGALATYSSQNLLSDNATALQGSSATGNLARLDLWPPSTGVAPSVTTSPAPAGSLDEALGLGPLTGPTAFTTVAQVQAVFPMACLPSSDATPRNHPDCASATVSTRVARAKKEAREAIIAYLAGAAVSAVSGAPNRLTNGDMLFVARPWIMSESTLAAPAVVTPPLSAPPLAYRVDEYTLYRDGPRDATNKAVNGIRNGLGLRNPDLDNNITSRDDMALKPQMSVVYHATNQGLHALRAGPCPTVPVVGVTVPSLDCGTETGGEELWAFVPFDQLGKLASLMTVQSRSNKTYILAAPVRISDVFVPGTASASVGGVSVTVGGVWRTLAIFGRGIAGKSLTALDVTVPGPFTSHSLNTRPPLVVWSRGNYDTNDGKVKSASNTYSHNVGDYDAYLKMGETWSVPAIARVNPADHVTTRGIAAEFAMFMGSGYSDVVGGEPLKGKTFYVMDVLTGDIIRNFTLADGTVAQLGLSLANVIPASPAIYTVETTTGLSPSGLNYVSNPVEASAKTVYFGDLHSRIWRYTLATPGTAPAELANLSASGDGDQPFANGFALLEFLKSPQIFTSGGRDSRVNLRTTSPRFRMYGYNDGVAANPVAPVTQLFARDFPVNYRGNSAPAAGFVGGDVDNNPATPDVPVAPIVFYTGLSFAAGSDVNQPCLSRFDSVLFALQGLTGLAALDLNSTSTVESDDAFATIQGQVLQNPHITTEGTLVVDRGLGAQAAPPPPAPPVTQPLPPQSVTTTLVVPGLQPGSAAYNALRATTTPWRAGTAVCNVNP